MNTSNWGTPFAVANHIERLQRERWETVRTNECVTCSAESRRREHVECRFRPSTTARGEVSGGHPDCRIREALVTLRGREAKEKLLEHGRVPRRFWPVLLGAAPLQQTQAVRIVRDFCERRGSLLVLSGAAGCGKSLAASWAVVRRGGVFQPVDELVRPLPDEEGTSSLVELKRCPVLVLDDLGDQHSPSGYAGGTLREILRARDHHELPTVLTTNLVLDSFTRNGREYVGVSAILQDRIMSRLLATENLSRGGGHRTSTDGDRRRDR